MPVTIVPKRRPTLRVSREHRQTIRRFIEETDWNAFWKRATEKAAEEIDAYRLAQARSRSIPRAFLAA